MKDSKPYDYKRRHKDLEDFKAKAVKVLHARLSSKLSFAEIARALNITDRSIVYKIYDANKNNADLVKLATVDK